jgi:hypothetical protein
LLRSRHLVGQVTWRMPRQCLVALRAENGPNWQVSHPAASNEPHLVGVVFDGNHYFES